MPFWTSSGSGGTSVKRRLGLCVAALYLLVMGWLLGALTERWLFAEQRQAVIARYTDLSNRLRERLMDLELATNARCH
jgi:hypothetical protein